MKQMTEKELTDLLIKFFMAGGNAAMAVLNESDGLRAGMVKKTLTRTCSKLIEDTLPNL